MATRKDPSPPQRRPQLAVPLEQAMTEFQVQFDRGSEIAQREINSWDQLKQARDDYFTWTEFVGELIRTRLQSDQEAVEFEKAARMMFAVGGPPNLGEDLAEHRSDVRVHLRRLKSVMERMPLFAGGGEMSVPVRQAEPSGRRVFVVHGHEKGPREAVARLLSRLDLTPVILEEEPNQGRTIIEKFEANADVAYAVVVMTPDDLGKAATDPGEPVPRGRQNVILELGFFIGLLGRHRVAAVVVGTLELPSDVTGIVYIPFDTGRQWAYALANEIKAARIDVDLNKV